MFARTLAAAVLSGLCLAAAGGGGALDAGSSLRFGFLPKKAFPGQPASASVVVRPTGVRCTASVRYADGSVQRLPAVHARAGKAAWRWTVPAKVKLGTATTNVACGRAGRLARSFFVTGPPAAPARVVVKKTGFSQRVRYNSRDVSYGIVLGNPSPENDALDVSVVVNFVDATNRVVATDTPRIGAVGAGAEYNLGSSVTIPDSSPVSKLEIVTRIGGQARKHKLGPAASDVLVQEARYDPGWVGAVVGQVTNDHPTMLLSSAQLSVVVFDSGGNVLGGGSGYSTSALMPGVRAYFSASMGVSPIPQDRVAGAAVSLLGRYEATS